MAGREVSEGDGADGWEADFLTCEDLIAPGSSSTSIGETRSRERKECVDRPFSTMI